MAGGERAKERARRDDGSPRAISGVSWSLKANASIRDRLRPPSPCAEARGGPKPAAAGESRGDPACMRATSALEACPKSPAIAVRSGCPARELPTPVREGRNRPGRSLPTAPTRHACSTCDAAGSDSNLKRPMSSRRTRRRPRPSGRALAGPKLCPGGSKGSLLALDEPEGSRKEWRTAN